MHASKHLLLILHNQHFPSNISKNLALVYRHQHTKVLHSLFQCILNFLNDIQGNFPKLWSDKLHQYLALNPRKYRTRILYASKHLLRFLNNHYLPSSTSRNLGLVYRHRHIQVFHSLLSHILDFMLDIEGNFPRLWPDILHQYLVLNLRMYRTRILYASKHLLQFPNIQYLSSSNSKNLGLVYRHRHTQVFHSL